MKTSILINFIKEIMIYTRIDLDLERIKLQQFLIS